MCVFVDDDIIIGSDGEVDAEDEEANEVTVDEKADEFEEVVDDEVSEKDEEGAGFFFFYEGGKSHFF